MRWSVNLDIPIIYSRLVKMICFFFLRYLRFNPRNSVIIIGERLYVNFICMGSHQLADCHNTYGFHMST